MKEENQYDILLDMQAQGFNVVTCGDCGDVMIHRTEGIMEDTLKCPYCGFIEDPCYFPDFFYEGWDIDLKNNKENKNA